MTPVKLGNARFTVYRPGCIRMEYAEEGRFSPYAPLIAGRRLPRPSRAVVERTKDRLVIGTERFTLEYRNDGREFSRNNLRIVHRNAFGKKIVWTPGKADSGNLGTVTRSLDNWKQQPDPCPVQGILSTDGGHLLENPGGVYWNSRYRWPENLARWVKFDGFFFAYGADYVSALTDLVHVLGRIPLVPIWALGFWYSRWYPYRSRDLLRLVERYRKEGIPIDVMMIDTDWRGGWAGYDWCRKYFPDPRRTLGDLHRLGVRVGLNDHPGYDAYEPLPERDSHRPAITKRLGHLPHEGKLVCDWSRPDAVRTWEEVLLGPFHDQGVDFWWIDGWTKSQFGGNDAQLWLNQRYFELREKKTGKRGIILSRWGGPGSHRYPVQFSGDTYSTWETLRNQVDFTADSCGLGAVYWSHDIGGFHDREIDEEIFIRWAQFGAFSPIFRTHSAFGIREPWKFSRKALRIFRHYTRLRYALLPYLYSLAWVTHRKGLPLVRPMYLESGGEDPRTYRARQQYMLGPFLMVVPAVGPAPKNGGCYVRRAYFPRGEWYELEGDRIISGPSFRMVRLPLQRIGIYVKEGAILPCATVGKNTEFDPSVIELNCYPGQESSDFELYEDDGESRDYLRGVYRRTRLRMVANGNSITIGIGPPRGKWKLPGDRLWKVRIRIVGNQKVDAAEYRSGTARWQRTSWLETGDSLAAEVTGGGRFAMVSVPGSADGLSVRVHLMKS